MQQERDHPLGKNRDEDFFTLYVNNLPGELNEDGIRQIFNTYGEICSLFNPPNANWAYISYKTYKEAEYAIRSLNEQSPLFLNVAFRKKKPQNKNAHQGSSIDHGLPAEEVTIRPNVQELPYLIDSKPIVPQLLMKTAAQYSAPCDVDISSVYPIDHDDNIYDPFEHVGRYADTNALWSRGRVCIDEYGKRWVTLGRGYTKYHIPEVAYPQVECQLQRVYEKRRSNIENGKGKIHSIGSCKTCGSPAVLRCSNCLIHYYCSKECQKSDWPRHSGECKPVPELTADFTTMTINTPDSMEERAKRRLRGLSVDRASISPLRHPRKSTIQGDELSDGAIPKNASQETPETKNDEEEILEREAARMRMEEQLKIEEQIKLEEQRSMQKKQEKPDISHQEQIVFGELISNGTSPRVNTGSSTSTESSAKLIVTEAMVHDVPKTPKPAIENKTKPSSVPPKKISNSNFLKMEDDLAFPRDLRSPATENKKVIEKEPVKKPYAGRMISQNTFEKVRVVYVMEDGTFWVNKNEDIQALETMMIELHEKAEKFPKVPNLTIGETYAVKFEDIWHRASILTTNPTQILYVDFGNIEVPQKDDFRSLKGFTNSLPFAIHLRLAAGSEFKDINIDVELFVKMINLDENGIFEVVNKTSDKLPTPQEIEPPKEPAPKTKQDSMPLEKRQKIPDHVISKLKIGDIGYIQFYTAMGENSYNVCVVSDELMAQYMMVNDDMLKVCEKMKTPDYVPQIGDFVCGSYEGIWVRGIVKSLGPPVRLMLVDETRVVPVKDVKPMPPEYEKICRFGSAITFETDAPNIKNDEAGQFEVLAFAEDNGSKIIRGHMVQPDHVKNLPVVLREWDSSPDQEGIGFAEIENNSQVVISAYRSERVMFVRSLDLTNVERNERVLQNIANLAENAPYVGKLPVIGQLVLAKFIDDNYYRAVVTKYVDKKISVSYIDYGNVELTTTDKLKKMPEELKKEKSCCLRVVLKGINSDKPPTKEAHQYLDLLVGKEEPLTMKFEGNPSKDGVTLLVTSSGESVNEKMNSLLTPSWKVEDPSKNLNCFMLNDLEILPLGAVGSVVDALPLHVTEPCSKYVLAPFDLEHIKHVTGTMSDMITEYCKGRKEHYIPRFQELCMAIWQGSWFRGACLERSATPNQALIYFIDYGNTSLVDHKDIREFTKDFMTTPATGVNCVLKNMKFKLENDKIPKKTLERFDELVKPNGLVQVKILRKASPTNQQIGGDYEIEFPAVREQLLKEDLVLP